MGQESRNKNTDIVNNYEKEISMRREHNLTQVVGELTRRGGGRTQQINQPQSFHLKQARSSVLSGCVQQCKQFRESAEQWNSVEYSPVFPLYRGVGVTVFSQVIMSLSVCCWLVSVGLSVLGSPTRQVPRGTTQQTFNPSHLTSTT